MNFHSCQTEGLPGEWSPRDLVPTFRTPSFSSSSSCSSTPSSPLPHLPKALLSESKGPPSAFSFFSRGQNKGKAAQWPRRALIRAGTGPASSKRSLSIAACRLGIGTNEAYHSLILIPFDLTHFIDSPCAPNEMLNLSPVAAVPRSYCYGDRGREGRGSAGEIPQHGGCSIKKKKKPHSSIPLSCNTALIFPPSLHLTLQTKGYTEKLLKN